MAKVSVIVVAAGRGQRFGGKENKVFAKLGEQPLFLRALQLFCNREDVCQTILVIAPADMEKMRTQYGPNLGFMGVQLVEGGAERYESVHNGLEAVSADADLVAVHDAARVCVAEPWIDAIFEAAAKFDAVVPTVPVAATLQRVGADNLLGEPVPREGLHMAQTPQAFKRELLQAAYAKLFADGIGEGQAPTDDAQVLAAAGHAVTAIEGDPRNIKITTKADLSLVGAVLKTLPQKQVSKRGAFDEAQW